jgi:hypothetical protein
VPTYPCEHADLLAITSLIEKDCRVRIKETP